MTINFQASVYKYYIAEVLPSNDNVAPRIDYFDFEAFNMQYLVFRDV